MNGGGKDRFTFTITAEDESAEVLRSVLSQYQRFGQEGAAALSEIGSGAHQAKAAVDSLTAGDSGLNKMLALLRGGGVAAGVHILGEEFARTTEQIARWRAELDAGHKSLAGILDEAARGAPIFGGWYRSGVGLGEMLGDWFTGKKGDEGPSRAIIEAQIAQRGLTGELVRQVELLSAASEAERQRVAAVQEYDKAIAEIGKAEKAATGARAENVKDAGREAQAAREAAEAIRDAKLAAIDQQQRETLQRQEDEALRQQMQVWEAQRRERKQQEQSIDDLVKRLEDEAATYGMTADQISLYRLKQAGATEAQREAARAAIEHKAALEGLAAAARDAKAAQDALRGAQATHEEMALERELAGKSPVERANIIGRAGRRAAGLAENAYLPGEERVRQYKLAEDYYQQLLSQYRGVLSDRDREELERRLPGISREVERYTYAGPPMQQTRPPDTRRPQYRRRSPQEESVDVFEGGQWTMRSRRHQERLERELTGSAAGTDKLADAAHDLNANVGEATRILQEANRAAARALADM
jgi:hypothetical protein